MLPSRSAAGSRSALGDLVGDLAIALAVSLLTLVAIATPVLVQRLLEGHYLNYAEAYAAYWRGWSSVIDFFKQEFGLVVPGMCTVLAVVLLVLAKTELLPDAGFRHTYRCIRLPPNSRSGSAPFLFVDAAPRQSGRCRGNLVGAQGWSQTHVPYPICRWMVSRVGSALWRRREHPTTQRRRPLAPTGC